MTTSNSNRRRIVATTALLAVVGGSAAAWVLGSRVQSPDQAAARAAAPVPSLVTAPVELRVLSSTVITRADVVPTVSTTVTAPTLDVQGGAGSGIVTGVFVSRGDQVQAGDRVVEVAGRPVFVFLGATPAYRAMRPGMSGGDIAQLQVGLSAGGCEAGGSGIYDGATKACVAQLYADGGYVAMRSSSDEIAKLTAARSAVTDAEDALAVAENTLRLAAAPAPVGQVSAAKTAVNEAQRMHDAAVRDQPSLIARATQAASDNVASTADVLQATKDTLMELKAAPDSMAAQISTAQAAVNDAQRIHDAAVRDQPWLIAEATRAASDNVASTADALQAAKDTLAETQALPDTSIQQLAVDQQLAAVERARRTLADFEAVSGPVVQFGEVVFVPQLPARVDSVGAVVGNQAAQQDPAQAGPGSLLVLASPTLEAHVAIPQTTRSLVQEGTTVELLYEATGETATGTVRSVGDELTTAATSGVPSYPAVVDAELPKGWSGLNLRATFTAATTDHKVLVVPAAAVSSSADGQTRVQAERADGTLDTVVVTTGLSADGFVQVIPKDQAQLAAGDRVVVGQ